MKAKARAHANIALIKYWGKADEKLAIPNNSSLSLTLDSFYTETEVEFDENLESDIFYLDDKEDSETLVKVSKFIDLFRKEKGISTKAKITSYNYVPTAAGLASSASAFSALGVACNRALSLNMDDTLLSTFIRKGSGSATRSIYGGLVEWQKGHDDLSSHAIKVDDADFDIGMVIVIVNSEQKELSSREGMKITTETSPFYKEWPNEAEKDLVNIKAAIKKRDFDLIGEITENNAMKMHATMMSSNPSIIYMEPKSLVAINAVKKLRRAGISAYFTMDAGPNVKVLCKLSDAEKIKAELLNDFNEDEVIISKVGSSAHII